MWPFTKHGPASSPGTPRSELRCSFCDKHRNDVRKLIAGPGVYICDKCIALCDDIVAEESEEREEAQRKEEAGWGASLPGFSSRAEPRVSPTALCRLCGLPTPMQDVIAVPDAASCALCAWLPSVRCRNRIPRNDFARRAT
ncbi:MAG: hypothetical protein DMD92_13060 [Candidatus Rokuibacteriota bacterium]|nr:MAG: hypothetical protein DMD92_13060 [Candidatus Rokubacteria bacterium]